MQHRHRKFLLFFALAALVVAAVFWFRRTAPVPAPAPIAKQLDWGHATRTSGCRLNGPLPDASCTPGDILPELTADTICSPSFRTSDVRDTVTSPGEKRWVYEMYGVPHPANNRGRNQVCEIDHLVSLELGGADTMANLWPQCSPGYAGWQEAGFRDKDRFENYLRRQVCSGRLPLAEAQFQIATDWLHYWQAAGKP
jgi:hypothetical protein